MEVQKGCKLEKVQEWKVQKKKDIATIVTPKAILQKQISQVETRWEKQIQRFFKNSQNKQTWTSCDYFIYFCNLQGCMICWF